MTPLAVPDSTRCRPKRCLNRASERPTAWDEPSGHTGQLRPQGTHGRPRTRPIRAVHQPGKHCMETHIDEVHGGAVAELQRLLHTAPGGRQPVRVTGGGSQTIGSTRARRYWLRRWPEGWHYPSRDPRWTHLCGRRAPPYHRHGPGHMIMSSSGGCVEYKTGVMGGEEILY